MINIIHQLSKKNSYPLQNLEDASGRWIELWGPGRGSGKDDVVLIKQRVVRDGKYTAAKRKGNNHLLAEPDIKGHWKFKEKC